MAKKRTDIPKAVGESVMKEYNHMCSVCGRYRPQLHHVDRNPANNDRLNLLPLCPNCHLQDAHDPTQPPDSRRLRLFRLYKDPMILDPRFQPVFKRMLPLYDEGMRKNWIKLFVYKVNELLDFIEELEMGKFYRKKLHDYLQNPIVHHNIKRVQDHTGPSPDPAPEQYEANVALQDEAFRYSLGLVEELIVEQLRYQGWVIQERKALADRSNP
jgi:hypothetical protein